MAIKSVARSSECGIHSGIKSMHIHVVLCFQVLLLGTFVALFLMYTV